MTGLLKRLLTWWTGPTLGTQLFTWRKGRLVGSDGEGNRFYQNADGSRRWVVYDGEPEASRVTPQWHGWLHHTYENPPTVDPLPRQAWEKGHESNLTGSPEAYAPAGSLRAEGPAERRDYSAWSPE